MNGDKYARTSSVRIMEYRVHDAIMAYSKFKKESRLSALNFFFTNKSISLVCGKR